MTPGFFNIFLLYLFLYIYIIRLLQKNRVRAAIERITRFNTNGWFGELAGSFAFLSSLHSRAFHGSMYTGFEYMYIIIGTIHDAFDD